MLKSFLMVKFKWYMKRIGIIGAGASGLYAAINIDKENDITILEKNKSIGKKILMTGNGRCNITNASFYDDFLDNIMTNKKFMYSSFTSHDNYSSMEFFESRGLDLVTEEENRVFPKSQRASDVVKFYEYELIKRNIKLVTEAQVLNIKKDEVFKIETQARIYEFDILIIATGGLSYPNTGSTGDGYKFAKNFGHNITKTYPNLVPIFFKDKDLSTIKALSLDSARITVETKDGTFSESGPILISKNFITGPTVLSLSSYIVGKDIKSIRLNLVNKDRLDLDSDLIEVFDKNPNKDISNVLKDICYNVLADIILKRAKIDPARKANQITKTERFNILENLINFKINFERLGGFNTAVITKGGIDTKDINPRTMESKLVDDLYFIGEVLDIDALTGGYNLQLAYTTAYASANDINKITKEAQWLIS